jgi:hypothetical protein
MLKSLFGNALEAASDVRVETVLTLAFVAQFAVHAASTDAASAIAAGPGIGGASIVDIGTVVQMPAEPTAGRVQRAALAREKKVGSRRRVAGAAKAGRPRAARSAGIDRPQAVGDQPGAEELEQLRSGDGILRVTVIGPDGELRTKLVRLSGSRDGTAAPARRPRG